MNSTLTQDDQYTILLIDDHPMLRSGVKQLISLEPQLKVIGEASTVSKALNWPKSSIPI